MNLSLVPCPLSLIKSKSQGLYHALFSFTSGRFLRRFLDKNLFNLQRDITNSVSNNLLGDGKDVIEDYRFGVDTVMILSGEVKAPKVNDAGDVTFKIGSGQLTFPNSANQSIELVDASGSVKSTYNPK